MDSPLPSGTVTFLFTDIEGSTELWEQHPEAMKTILAQHDAALKQAIETNHGRLIKTTGDGVHAVFVTVLEAAQASAAIQKELQTSKVFDVSSKVPFRVRMGLHTGEAELRDGDYYGPALNRAARIMSIANGGQILLSSVSAELLRDQLPEGITLLDMGEHRLKNLSRPENLFQLSAPGLQAEFPPLKSLNVHPNNLPAQLTSFIGREKAMVEIKALLESARLVTLTGSGGTGKTRLSQAVGAEMLPSFPHGVWLIELAPLTDPLQIIPAMAGVFGLQEVPSMPLAVIVTNYLRDKRALLLLDNCEHLIQACARLADDLLRQCTGLKILASSREALGIAGERAYHTPSLADPESRRLFLDRARGVDSDFSLTEANASAVDQICSRLDGIPLAIELAAARAKLLSPEQIAERLDDRFRLLVGGSRTSLPRQQTLRALIDWSFDLLSEQEKALLCTASVFAGGWTLDAIEAVSDDPNALGILEGLVNKSLVVTEERHGEMRYSMLETIRQYARERLFDAQQTSAVRDRHFAYFDALSEQMWEAFRSSDLLHWRDRADEETENLYTALEWGLQNYAEAALHLAANLCVISYWINNQSQILTLVKTAVQKVRALPPAGDDAGIRRQDLIARALYGLGMIGLGAGDLQPTTQYLTEAISITRNTGNKLILGYCLQLYFTTSTFISLPDAEEAAQEGLRIFTEEIQDSWGLGMAYMTIARIASGKGDQEKKQEYLKKFGELRRGAPMSTTAGMFWMGMGFGESEEGNYEAATEMFNEALRIFSRLRIRDFQLVVQSELGHIARYKGNLGQAKAIYRETIPGWEELGNRGAIAHQMECFASMAITEHELQRAVRLFGAAEALRERSGSGMTDMERREYERTVARARPLLDTIEFDSLWTEGRSMTMEEAIEYAVG